MLKLKGVKKNFSKDPIDFEKIRKEDIHRPKSSFFRKNKCKTFQISNTLITEVKRNDSAHSLVLFIHGGAFISGPAKHHWDSIKKISTRTAHTLWMCDYPKAPEHKISEISINIDLVYEKALEEYAPEQIILLGDSVGATLITALTQRLLQKNMALPLKIILVSPVMDATMSNSEIDTLEHKDPMLSKLGVHSAKKMCAENDDLKNEMISPLYGSFIGFPTTILFLAENDITYPDQCLAVVKLKQAKVNIEVIQGANMPHIWPFLPLMKEAKQGLEELLKRLN